ncbi:MAG: hypothetical protein JWM68_3222 [Verrucomicrobiales bacterium]|nr:hypothetical protein [Verrucomicrobiales bacterium]
MGLESVELVMAIEDEFSIAIGDADAERMQTVGDLFDYVRQAVQIKMRPAPSDDEVWCRIKKIVVEQLGVKPEQVTREARFVQDLGMD